MFCKGVVEGVLFTLPLIGNMKIFLYFSGLKIGLRA
jgi:hypothetical protein